MISQQPAKKAPKWKRFWLVNAYNMKSTIKFAVGFCLIIFCLVGCLPPNENLHLNEQDEKHNSYATDSNQALSDSFSSTANSNDTLPFLSYGVCLNTSGQVPFKTKALKEARVKLFSRYKDRIALGITSLSNVHGIHQFFMDHDLTSGFVHEYTRNFFNKLPQEGFVLKIDRSPKQINEGVIRYIRKKDLKPGDVLGQNLAFCRQWKLSDFDLNGFQVMMKKSTYKQDEYCPQLKRGLNPFTLGINEIPIWSTYAKEGYVDYRLLNSLTDYDGGTAVIIWTDKEGEILFMDIHGSIADILNEANRVKKKYNTDPSIGIYDAGTFARKFKADSNGNVSFEYVNKLTGKTEFVGAGFGYVK